MNESIFREKSLKKISSPDDLNEYITVVKPSVWLILGAIVCVLVGAYIWGIFGVIESTEQIGIISDGKQCYTIYPVSKIQVAQEAIGVKVDGEYYSKEQTKEGIDRIDTSKLNEGSFTVYYKFKLPEGQYTADLVLEIIHPFDFLTSSK